MEEPAERRRTVIRAPRVDFDLSALVLGAGGWLAYQLSWPALASILQVPDNPKVPAWYGLRSEFFARLFGWMGLPYSDGVLQLVGWPGIPMLKDGDKQVPYSLQLDAWKLAVVGAWLLVLWSVVAGAICRVHAVRIARDESIGTGDAVAFSLSNLKAFLLAPLFVMAACALVLAFVALAGAASAVPYVGPFLEIVLHPLALVAGLLATLIAVGGVFGFPVMQAALATERNGTLDAVSRTFSYVFTRPVVYIVSIVVVTGVSGVILKFGEMFIELSTRAMTFGASWNADAAAPLDAPRAIEGGAKFVFSPGGVLAWPHVADKIDGSAAVWIYVAWAFTAIAWIALNGFVLSYFVGGLTDTYFLLRREVDGIDDSEVYMEGAETTLGEPLVGEPTSPPARQA